MPRRKKTDPELTWMKALHEVMRTIPKDRQMVVIVEHESGVIGANSTCCGVCAFKMVQFAAHAMGREIMSDDCEELGSMH